MCSHDNLHPATQRQPYKVTSLKLCVCVWGVYVCVFVCACACVKGKCNMDAWILFPHPVNVQKHTDGQSVCEYVCVSTMRTHRCDLAHQYVCSSLSGGGGGGR
ncbi:unnamed protein product [Arctogadus glacialis]